jgi:hypothetical protein
MDITRNLRNLENLGTHWSPIPIESGGTQPEVINLEEGDGFFDPNDDPFSELDQLPSLHER